MSSRTEVARVPDDRTREHDCLVRVWHAILVAHARVSHRLEAELMTRSRLSLADYDVLAELERSDGRLRMSELADCVLLSRSGLTRLVDRLGADGLVDRQKCPSDARGAFAVLTDAGRRRLDAARPFHLEAVKDHFLGAYSQAELDQLAELLGRVVERAAAPTTHEADRRGSSSAERQADDASCRTSPGRARDRVSKPHADQPNPTHRQARSPRNG